jgi:phosphate acyltransferase
VSALRRARRVAPAACISGRAGASVALDAMGGDHGPGELVAGAVLAARRHGVRVILAGQARLLHRLLAVYGAGAGDGIEVADAPEVIAMCESGVRLRTRRDTSAAVACGLVASGQAGAVVSAGSTGGAVATATAQLGCAAGVLRPAIAVILPTAASPTVLLDAGATADPTPQMLAQFAVLGSAYASAVLGLAAPAVGFLTIGAEPGKGNRLARRAQPLLRDAPVKFTGNVESGDVLAGAADVVVTDGFTGNVLLKAVEGSVRLAVSQTRQALGAGPAGALAALVNRRRMYRLAGLLDPDAHGGALLLGVQGTAVIAHGSARAAAISRACVLARDVAVSGTASRAAAALAAERAG